MNYTKIMLGGPLSMVHRSFFYLTGVLLLSITSCKPRVNQGALRSIQNPGPPRAFIEPSASFAQVKDQIIAMTGTNDGQVFALDAAGKIHLDRGDSVDAAPMTVPAIEGERLTCIDASLGAGAPTLVVGSESGKVFFGQPAQMRPLPSEITSPILSVRVSGDSKLVAAATFDGLVYVWQVDKNDAPVEITGGDKTGGKTTPQRRGSSSVLVFLPDNSLLAGRDKVVERWYTNLTDQYATMRIQLEKRVTALSVVGESKPTTASRAVVAVGLEDGSVKLFAGAVRSENSTPMDFTGAWAQWLENILPPQPQEMNFKQISGEETAQLFTPERSGVMNSIWLSSTDPLMGTGYENGVMQVFSLEQKERKVTPQLQRQAFLKPGRYRRMIFEGLLPRGIVSALPESNVPMVWNFHDQVHGLALPEKRFTAAAFTADGAELLTFGHGFVQFFSTQKPAWHEDILTPIAEEELPGTQPVSVEIYGDTAKQYVLTGHCEGQAFLWQKDGTHLKQLADLSLKKLFEKKPALYKSRKPLKVGEKLEIEITDAFPCPQIGRPSRQTLVATSRDKTIAYVFYQVAAPDGGIIGAWALPEGNLLFAQPGRSVSGDINREVQYFVGKVRGAAASNEGAWPTKWVLNSNKVKYFAFAGRGHGRTAANSYFDYQIDDAGGLQLLGANTKQALPSEAQTAAVATSMQGGDFYGVMTLQARSATFWQASSAALNYQIPINSQVLLQARATTGLNLLVASDSGLVLTADLQTSTLWYGQRDVRQQ